MYDQQLDWIDHIDAPLQVIHRQFHGNTLSHARVMGPHSWYAIVHVCNCMQSDGTKVGFSDLMNVMHTQ